MTELLLGCGHSRAKKMGGGKFKELVTLDNNVACEPDLLCDLDQKTWVPRTMKFASRKYIADNGQIKRGIFDEIHAYEVLEHLGSQGDHLLFFAHFGNIHRMLVANGLLFASVPSRFSPWLWGDPSHRRAILPESLAYLSQDVIRYNRDHGTTMSDFSSVWKYDFKIVDSRDDKSTHWFCLQAIK